MGLARLLLPGVVGQRMGLARLLLPKRLLWVRTLRRLLVLLRRSAGLLPLRGTVHHRLADGSSELRVGVLPQPQYAWAWFERLPPARRGYRAPKSYSQRRRKGTKARRCYRRRSVERRQPLPHYREQGRVRRRGGGSTVQRCTAARLSASKIATPERAVMSSGGSATPSFDHLIGAGEDRRRLRPTLRQSL